ncbi:unnamed protein product [Caenorhabditis brenneri]
MSNDSKRGQKRPAGKDGSNPKTKRTSAPATPPPPQTTHPLSLLSILVLACAKAFIPGKDDAFFVRREQWRRQLDRDDLLVGSKEFVEIFARGEALYLHNSETAQHIRVHDDGTNYEKKIGNFDGIHLFKKKTDLGLVVPDLTPANLKNYLDVNKYVKVIGSNDQNEYSLKIKDLLDRLEDDTIYRDQPYNLISMECTKDQYKLHKQITVPTFVSGNAIIQKLESLLRDEYFAIREKKSSAHPIATYLNAKMKNMPRYQKFLLLSMKNSFTGVHVDPAATSVYYHVLHGKKVFYVCPPTKKNLEIYKYFERRPDQSKWVGDVLFDGWQRIEINAGETAMIPAGWIHFVFTPEDSIVIGGNFLTEQSMEMQFEIARLEEELLKTKPEIKSNTFQGFRNIMWMYLERILIPAVRYAHERGGLSETLKARALLFQKEMNPLQHGTGHSWKSTSGRHDLLEELGAAMGEPLANTRPQVMSHPLPVHDAPVRRSSRIKDAENTVVKEESEEEEDEDE